MARSPPLDFARYALGARPGAASRSSLQHEIRGGGRPLLGDLGAGPRLRRHRRVHGQSDWFLRIFEDVVTLIVNNYVEEVQVDKVMKGAMHGLAEGLDPDSAYLNVGQVKPSRRRTWSGRGRRASS